MRISWIFVILTINSLFAGEIITTNDFKSIEIEVDQLDEDSLLLFDVDATLIVPKDAVLKPNRKDLFKQLISGHTDRDLFRDIRMKAPHALVDNRSVSLVRKLQQSKIPVIAFTAAPSRICETEELGVWRVDELQRYGFDFSPAFPDSDFLELPRDVNQQHVPLFKSGVLYSSFHPKGDILTLFLQKLDLQPRKVIFVDDELEHVQSVVRCLDKQDIPCLGIHYTAGNDVSSNLNMGLARFQVNYFVEYHLWVGDNLAEIMWQFAMEEAAKIGNSLNQN